jgi:hypothetical protein
VDRHAAADDLEDAADLVAIFRKVTAPELEPGKLARPSIGRCDHHLCLCSWWVLGNFRLARDSGAIGDPIVTQQIRGHFPEADFWPRITSG